MPDLFFDNIRFGVFFLSALMTQCLLLCLYCGVIGLAIFAVRKLFGDKMGVRARYYSWYALLLCIPLASMDWNDAIKLTMYSAQFYDPSTNMHAIIVTLWVGITLSLLIVHLARNGKVQKKLRRLQAFEDTMELKDKAAESVGLRAERIHIVAADFIRSPVSYGVFKTWILLPADYQSRYSESELYLLLLHEMSHIKNRDTAKLYFIGLAECFVGILRLFRKPFRRDSEILSDNRVMGLREKDRDVYGELLLKESAGANAIKGFAFSDSYHTLKSRLESLYRFKPEKHKMALFAAVIFLVEVVTLTYSYCYPASWLYLNEEHFNKRFSFNIEYDDPKYGISSTNPDHLITELKRGEGELIEQCEPPIKYAESVGLNVGFRDVYEITNGTIRVDKLAWREAIQPFVDHGASITGFELDTPAYSIDYSNSLLFPVMGFSQNDFSKTYRFAVEELEYDGEQNRYYTRALEGRGIAEFLYTLAARWF